MTISAKKRMDQKILIWIDKELLASLDSLANKKGWNRSLIIREAIRDYIKKRSKNA